MKQITDLKNDANIYVVIGEVGSGKTNLIRNHPANKKVLISFDSSYSTVADVPLMTVYEPDKTDFMSPNKFMQELTVITRGAGLVVFDNISALEATIAYNPKEITGNADGRAAYGYVQKFLYDLAEWSKHFTGDVLVTAWSRNKEGNGGYSIDPDMNEKAFSKIAGFATTVSRTVADQNGYRVILSPDGLGVIKNRVNHVTQVPNEKYWNAVKYIESKAALAAEEKETVKA